MSKSISKKYYSNTMEVAWPSVLESIFMSLTGMIDTYMVSGLGPEAVAAVGLTVQPKFLFFTPFLATAVALSAIVARRKGERNHRSANEAMVTGLALNLVETVLISLICVFQADNIIHLMGSAPETHQLAVDYFTIVMAGMIFTVIPSMINSSQRGSGNTRLSFFSNLVGSIVNIIFNYLLIQGHGGFPALGVKGAAIATVIGSIAMTLVSFFSLFWPNSYLSISYIRRRKIKPSRAMLKTIRSLSIATLLENLMMRVGFVVTAWKAAGLGTDPFAAHQVGMNILNMGFAIATGMEAAAMTMVGQSLGAENKKDAIKYGRVCQRIGWIFDAVYSVILLFFGRELYALHFENPEIIDMGVMISHFVMIIVFLQATQIVYGGCLRAAGDVKYTLVAGIVSVTIIRSLVTILLVDKFHMGLRGIWIGVLADQTSRVVFMSHRYHEGKWVDMKI